MRIRSITDEEIETYHREGFCYLPGLVDDETVEKLLTASDRRMANPGKYAEELASEGRFFQEQYLFNEVPEFKEFMTNQDMAKNAARAMGSNTVRAYFDHLFACEPETTVDFYWHQDLAYWPIEGQQICSFWLSLTHCNRESSALQFVRGTGKGNKLFRQVNFGEEELEGEHEEIEYPEDSLETPIFHEHPDLYETQTWDFNPGDAVLFTSRVVHSGGGNASKDMRRVAYSSRWIGEDTRFHIHPGYQDPTLFPDKDENISVGEPLNSRRFPLVWSK